MFRQPEVSIILPTYNRANTLMRAIKSVVNQTFVNWELIVVDDGSTDETTALDLQFDARIRLLRQQNAGVPAARNAGIDHSHGDLLTFLDSDDEWLPHYLEICIGFLRASPNDMFVTTEFYKGETEVRDNRHAILSTYLPVAQMIGSRALDLPAGVTDDYLRVFPSREALGEWASSLNGTDEYLYRGDIFEQTRWGYFAWLPTTVLRREAWELVGPFEASVRSASDYQFLAKLARHFRTNFISVPLARKHESDGDARPLEHLATGSNLLTFRFNRLRFFDELHWKENQDDVELMRIRRHYAYKSACIALRQGKKRDAIRLFGESSAFEPYFWRAYVMRLVATLFPASLSARYYSVWRRFAAGPQAMRHMNI